MKKARLTRIEQQLLRELLLEQTTRIGVRKSERKGWQDLPLFRAEAPTLFDNDEGRDSRPALRPD